MGIKYLLDSVILIDHLNGNRAATDYIFKVHSYCAISVVTRAEVLIPYEASVVAPVLRLLDTFITLPIDGAAADKAAALRRVHKWKLPDAFQAALAEVHGIKLVTRNPKDFPPKKFNFVIEPY